MWGLIFPRAVCREARIKMAQSGIVHRLFFDAVPDHHRIF